MNLLPAPDSLIDSATSFPAFGRYHGSVKDLSTRRWDGDAGLFSPRRLQRKTWLYLGAFSPRLMVGFAVVDAGLLGTAFVYVFDRERRTLVEDKINVPFGFAKDFAGTLDARWALAQGGKRWLITPTASGWRCEFGSPKLQLSMEFTRRFEGMTTVAQSPERPFHSTFKDCMLKTRIHIKRGSEDLSVDADGMADFTLGYPPRRTFWNWAALSGTTGDGRQVGLNLVAHFNNGLENALWVGDRIVPLAQAQFIYDPANLDMPWRVSTADGVIDLRFVAEGRRSEHINALVLGSRFVQMFGRFEGTLALDGRATSLTAFGVTEEHAAVW